MSKKNVRYWIFQCNPTRFELHTYLNNHDYIYWAANQHKDQIQLGDGIFIWRAAAGGHPRGVIALGFVCEAPTQKSLVNYPNNIRDDLWRDAESHDALVVGIRLEDVRLTVDEGMILADLLSADESLSQMTIMRSWFQTNYKVTYDEARVLNELWGATGTDNLIDYDAMTSPEGKLKLAVHFRRERNPMLRDKAKELFKEKHGGKLFCEVCDFSFEDTYGQIGRDFIEAHHIKPISQMTIGDVTKISDLKMLCSNCHRMAHREDGWDFLLSKFNKEI